MTLQRSGGGGRRAVVLYVRAVSSFSRRCGVAAVSGSAGAECVYVFQSHSLSPLVSPLISKCLDDSTTRWVDL